MTVRVAFFDAIPLWLMFVGTIGLIFGATKIGSEFGSWRRRALKRDNEAPIGTFSGAVLGLLAFLLAFTFSMGAQRFEVRREKLLEEVNAIGTTFLRTDLVPAPHRTELRRQLREYVDLRVALVQNYSVDTLKRTIEEADRLQAAMWKETVALSKAEGPPPIHSLLIQSMNDMFDCQSTRLTVSQYHIPGAIWMALYGLVLIASLSVGYQFGLAGRIGWEVKLVLALMFSIVLQLIADLDRNNAGLLQIDHKPMFELQQSLNAAGD